MKNLLNFKTFGKLNGARLSLAPFLILLYLIPVQLLSQQSFNYFNKRIDFNSNYDRAKNVLPVDSNYVVAGITEDSTHYYHYHLSLSKFDSNGNTILHKEYGYDSINILMGNPGTLKHKNDNFYTAGVYWTYTATFRHQYGIITCYNENLDTLWTKKFGESSEPYDTLFVIDQMEFSDNNNFAFIGGRMPEYDPSRIWLLKTDSLGNKLWEHFYGEGEEYFQGHSVVQTDDGGYVIGAGKFTIQATGGSVDPLIIKTDSLGIEEWRINPGNPNVDDSKVMVALAQDGNIIAGTNYGTEQSGDNRWAVIKVMKITPGGTVLWDYNYLEPQYDNFLLNTIVLSSGNIIVNGTKQTHHLGDEYPAGMGWILCIDSLGNQLWYKEYALLTGHNSDNNLYDVRETPDGGLIGCGMVYPVVPDTGTADIWLMKMDSMGCLEPGCDTTVIVEETVAPEGEFKLYPNPVTGEFTINVGETFSKTCRIVFYNLYGVKMDAIKIPKGKRIVHVNASGWQPGLYVAMISQQGKIVGKKKFVVK